MTLLSNSIMQYCFELSLLILTIMKLLQLVVFFVFIVSGSDYVLYTCCVCTHGWSGWSGFAGVPESSKTTVSEDESQFSKQRQSRNGTLPFSVSCFLLKYFISGY